jgi:predicted RNA-binding protein with PUA-like domain
MSAPAPRRWLVKEEPDHYAHQDLVRDGRTEWNGVHNPLALRSIRAMRPDDPVLYYHTGGVRAIVGLARVAGTPHEDPDDERGSWSVTIAADRALARPVSLDELKVAPEFAGSPLLRIGRLSVLELTPSQWARVLALEREPPAAPVRSRTGPVARAGGRRRPPSAGGRRRRAPRGSGVAPRSRARAPARGTDR